MKAILKSSDPVLVSFAESVLADAAIPCVIFDHHMNITEGSIGIFPKRLMVPDERLTAARRVLTDAGLAADLADDRAGA